VSATKEIDGRRSPGYNTAMMRKTLTAIYEQGVFRPLEPPDLPEQQRVTLIVSAMSPSSQEEDWLDVECLKECAAEADERVSLEEVRAALTKIPGSLTADFIAERDERF
jgi:predicted DNA-binding antitoxin AbrB/MazE fold protein